MPKVPVQEVFSRGLVTSRPAHMLSAGELTIADNTVYRENNPCIVRAPEHGKYSDDNLSTYFAGGTVTGLVSTNFSDAEQPNQLIARVGSDLLISAIEGPSGNNNWVPVTGPARINGTFETSPIIACNFTKNSRVVTKNGGGAFSPNDVFVGRALYTVYTNTTNPLLCPPRTTYIITGIQGSAGAPTGFLLNTVPNWLNNAGTLAAGTTATNVSVVLAPKFNITGRVFYNTSIGFGGVIPEDSIIVESTVAATDTTANGVTVFSPSTPGTFNKKAIVGRSLTKHNTNNTVQTGYISHINVTSGDVTGINTILVASPKTPAASARFDFDTNLAPFTITAVGGTTIPSPSSECTGYQSCYLNIFPSPGDYELIFYAGVGRIVETVTPYFDALSWDNSSFVYDGESPLQKITYEARTSYYSEFQYKSAPVARPAALLPVETEPTLAVLTGSAGDWNTTANPAGHFWFIITEAFVRSSTDTAINEYSDTMLESAYTAKSSIKNVTAATPNSPTAYAETTASIGRPVSAYIAADTNYVELTFPAPRNQGSDGRIATHWAVYISKTQANGYTPPQLSTLTRTALVPISRYSPGQKIILKDRRDVEEFSPITMLNYPARNAMEPTFWSTGGLSGGSVAVGKPYQLYTRSSSEWNDSQAGGVIFTDWRKRTTTSPSVIGAAVNPTVNNVTRSIIGLEVKTTIVGSKKSGYYAYLKTVYQGGENPSLREYGGNGHREWLGGANENWGIPLASIDYAGIQLVVLKHYTGSEQHLKVESPFNYTGNHPPLSTPATFNESGKGPILRIYWSTNTVHTNGPPYKCVIYNAEFTQVSVSDPAMLPPPVVSIVDSFQGSLVTNDTANRNFIRYSMPDRPEMFPSPYRMKMGTKKKGNITCIKSINNVLIIGMERAIRKVNYLPKENSTNFLEEVNKVVEDVSVSHGIVGPYAYTEFDMPGMGSLLAYVSPIGLRMTDGQTTRALNTDVNLGEYIHQDYWEHCVLKAYPVQKWLILYYVPKGSTHGILSKSFVFSFSEDHIKAAAALELTGTAPLNGPLPVLGPNDCYIVDATETIINSTPQVATTDGEYIFIEDSSASSVKVRTTTSSSNATKVNRVNAPRIRSRDIFPAGPTMDSNIGAIYLTHESKGNQFVRTDATSTKGSTTLTFNSSPIAHVPVVGERIIHGGWDNVVTILGINNNNNGALTMSEPAVRTITTDATYDTGNIMVRINAAQLGEELNPVVTEYRSTSVGVNQTFLVDVSANRFAIDITKVENPNTGQLNDLDEEMSIAGLVYHATTQGPSALHTN